MTLFEVLSVCGSVLLVVIGIAGGLFRYAVSQKQREYENTFRELSKKNERQDDENRRTVDRLHEQEKVAQALSYELKLTNQSSSNLLKDVEEIKGQMVTKVEFQQLQKTITDALVQLRSSSYRQAPSRSETPFPTGGPRR